MKRSSRRKRKRSPAGTAADDARAAAAAKREAKQQQPQAAAAAALPPPQAATVKIEAASDLLGGMAQTVQQQLQEQISKSLKWLQQCFFLAFCLLLCCACLLLTCLVCLAKHTPHPTQTHTEAEPQAATAAAAAAVEENEEPPAKRRRTSRVRKTAPPSRKKKTAASSSSTKRKKKKTTAAADDEFDIAADTALQNEREAKQRALDEAAAVDPEQDAKLPSLYWLASQWIPEDTMMSYYRRLHLQRIQQFSTVNNSMITQLSQHARAASHTIKET
jgi:hypothetical protein